MGMEVEAAQIRAELAMHAGGRYPAALVTRVLAHLARRQRAGWTVSAVAGELGVARQGLHRWMRERRESGLAVRPVVVASAAPLVGTVVTARPVLYAPRGVRVEGLGVEELAQLLRRLE